MPSDVLDRETDLAFDGLPMRINIPLLATGVLLASVLAALAVGQVGNVFVMPQDFSNMPLQPSSELLARYNAAVSMMMAGNYATHFAILGASLGAAIGLAGGTRNRWLFTFTTALGGMLAGAIGGYVMGLASSYLVNEIQGESVKLLGMVIDPMLQTTALQCFIWSLIGVGIGCGCTLANRQHIGIMAGIEIGLMGGVLGGLTYSISAAMLFSVANAFLFIPEKLTERIVWAAIGGLSIAIGLVYSVAKRSPRRTATAQSSNS